MTANEFVLELKDMLQKWGWPEWLIKEKWPRIVDVLVGVGILKTTEDGFELTLRVQDDAVWETAWDALKKEGIVGGESPAA